MPDHNHYEGNLPAYALGVLDEDEAAQVSAHLAGCSACQSELEDYETIAADLSLAAAVSEPPLDLKRRLFDRVQSPRSTADSSSREPRWRMAPRLLSAWGVVSLLLIVALAIGSLFLWQRVNQIEQAYRPGGMYAFSLTGTEILPEAGGYLIAGADGRNGAVIVDKLPPLDSEREYQLWLIKDGEYTSGALIAVDDLGYGGRRVAAPENLLTYSAASITIEPAGGSPHPTGEIVLVGTLTSP